MRKQETSDPVVAHLRVLRLTGRLLDVADQLREAWQALKDLLSDDAKQPEGVDDDN